MSKQLFFAGAAALVLATPAAAVAHDEPIELEGVVATGARAVGGIEAERLGGSLTVIGTQAMEARQVRVVADVLRDVPGVAVSRTGQHGALTQIRIRGAEANHTLTLIDGIEANDPFQGEFDYATLLADDLARIEVLRGQQSALYGSDAIAGVVHYITPSGREAPGLRLRAEAGSFETFGLAARQAGVLGGLDYALTGAYQTSGGYPVQTDGRGTRDLGADNLSLGARLEYRLGPALRLRGAARLTHTEADANNAPFASGSLVVDSPGTGYEALSLYGLVALDYEAMDGLWSHSLSIQGVDAWRDYLNVSGFSPFVRDSRNEGGRIKASYVTTFRIEGAVAQSLTGAVDYERETYAQPLNPFGPPLTDRETENWGYVLDYAAELAPGTGLGASVRRDVNDRFQDSTTYRLQAYHRLTEAVRLRAAAGTGIKNPTHFELFGFGFSFQGNPQLEPETSKGWEAGADLSLFGGRARAGFTYFDSRLKDEIFSFFGGVLPPGCPAPPPGFNTACNRATTSTQRGVELYADAELSPQWRLQASYTHLRAREDGFQEIRRAPHIASVNLGWSAPDGRFGANLTVRYNGAQQDSNFSILTPEMFATDPSFTPLPSPPHPFGRVELPAFTLVNLAGRWNVTDTIELFGRVENLLDEYYWEVITFPAPGRAAYAGVRARF